jgi:TonB-dependent receptor
VKSLKFGARYSERDKRYHQTTWSVNATSLVPDSAYETVVVPGLAPFIALKDFDGTTAAAFGADAFSAAGRTPTMGDLLAGWDVKEHSGSLFTQADLDGELAGHAYRGNVGLRVVHTSQTSTGMESDNGGAPAPTAGGASYTELLPSMNLIFSLDEKQDRQIRLGVARAMARAPLDEMRASRNLNIDQNVAMPITGSAGNPGLKPMLSDQIDLAYQWYFQKNSLASAGVFFKHITGYIGIATDVTSIDGREADITRSVNGKGGHVRGIELVYQQAFTGLPSPFDGLGVFTDYSYTQSDIKENTPAADPYPIEGLMRHNGGFTLWYEKGGFEARFSANHHSPFVRNPTWTSGQLIVNGAETYLTLNLSQQLTKNVQLRFGIDNIGNQKAIYTSGNNPFQQEVTEFGRRYNAGLTFKL